MRVLSLAAALAASLALAAEARGETGPAPSPDDVTAAAFGDAQMAVSSRTGLALAQSAARISAGDPALSQLVLRRQAAEAEYRAVDAALVAARARPDAAAGDRVAVLSQSLDKARADLAATDAEIERRYPAFADLVSPAPAGLGETQALLNPDEALVVIVPGQAGVHLFAVRKTSVQWARSSATAVDVARLAGALRARLDPSGAVRAGVDAPGDETAAPSGFPRSEAHELYRAVWAPMERSLKGARTVYVVTGDELSNLPLSVLVTAAPRGRDDDPAALRATPWLIKRHALATLPSVRSLKALRVAQTTGGAEPFAGFGDPSLEGQPGGVAALSRSAVLREGAVDVATLKSLPRLPETRGELERLAAALGAGADSVRLGPQATETAVKAADLSKVRVVAFATHGLLAGEVGGVDEPGLVLTPPDRVSETDDGLLTATEAANLRLSADWVVLSACNTGGAGSQGGAGLSGLARAFFYAGAKALLVSHWRVRDDAAARLTTASVSAYAKRPKEGRAQALRSAMLEVMNDRSNPAFAEPSSWAPFVVAGEGR